MYVQTWIGYVCMGKLPAERQCLRAAGCGRGQAYIGGRRRQRPAVHNTPAPGRGASMPGSPAALGMDGKRLAAAAALFAGMILSAGERARPPPRSCPNTPPRRLLPLGRGPGSFRGVPGGGPGACWAARSPAPGHAAALRDIRLPRSARGRHHGAHATAPTRRGSNTAPAACRGCGT